MKLISEHIEHNLELIVEEDKKGKKTYMIEGIFAQAERKNRNGRIYPKAIMEKAVGKYNKDFVSNGRAVGELNHPSGPTINLDRVSHLVTEMNFQGNDVVGKAKILDTPNGTIAKQLLDGGVKLGVSTRGMGSLMNQNNGIIEQKAIEQMETEIKNAPRSDRYATEVREFKNFLSLLKQ